jgi:hypothetical protein
MGGFWISDLIQYKGNISLCCKQVISALSIVLCLYILNLKSFRLINERNSSIRTEFLKLSSCLSVWVGCNSVVPSKKDCVTRTCRSCFAASAPARVLNVTNPTGCKQTHTYNNKHVSRISQTFWTQPTTLIRGLFEKLIAFQLVKRFATFYRNGKLIDIFLWARHFMISLASSTYFSNSPPFRQI